VHAARFSESSKNRLPEVDNPIITCPPRVHCAHVERSELDEVSILKNKSIRDDVVVKGIFKKNE